MSSDFSKQQIGVVVSVVVIAVVILAVVFSPSPETPTPGSAGTSGDVTGTGKNSGVEGQIGAGMLGGSDNSGDGGLTPEQLEELDYGLTPAVDPEANANTKSVSEAYRKKKYPERLTHVVMPKAFDVEAFKKDPQAYLDVVEPGRVYQTAQPGPNVPRLGRVSDYFHVAAQGTPVKLSVKGVPGTPISFNSFDLGMFENQLTSITVLTDESGVATATFTGTTGTIEDVNIMAGGPMTSGQVRFVVNVVKP